MSLWWVMGVVGGVLYVVGGGWCVVGGMLWYMVCYV